MELRRFDRISDFWQSTQAYLSQYPAENNLMLGIVHTLLYTPAYYTEAPYLAIAQTDSQVLVAAIRTPPYNLVLSKAGDLQAIKLIAADLQNSSYPLPGVSGLVAEVDAFKQAWQVLPGQSFQRTMEMRIHQLTHVEPVAAASGYLRQAAECDRRLLLTWFQHFIDEAIAALRASAEHLTHGYLQEQSVYLWDDQIPVALACGKQFHPTAARIGPVYTPPEYRRRGYATTCVATLSEQFLKQGCEHCFLFTDLANPTSNRIYAAIGYQPVCDWHEYTLASAQ